MKRLLKILIVLALALSALFLVLRTPETDKDHMRRKYGGALAQFTSGEFNVHFRDQGDPDGQAVIFIHGSNASLHTWENVIADMPANTRLISLDLPGHGLTGPHPKSNYRADGFFDAINAVVDELGLSDQHLILAGNSMGGWVSWRYALEYPERMKGLVLIDAAGIPTTEKPPLNIGFRLMRNPITRSLAEQITPRWLIRKSLLQTVQDPDLITEEMTDRYWELLRYPGNRRATVERSVTSRDLLEYSERLREIETPTLILWGETDQLIYVSSAETFDREIPNYTLIVYPNVGHIPMEESPSDVARDMTEFLESLKD